MLIEFKVTNYLSFRNQQTLSMVASNLKEKDQLAENRIDLDLPGLADLKYLKSVALYGSNASGKSNLLQALINLSIFVTSSAVNLRPNASTFAIPFKLSKETLEEPSSFEMTFVSEGVRYLFCLSLTRERVVEESLIAFPKGLAQRWYFRKWDTNKKEYEVQFKSPAFKKTRVLNEIVQRENSTLISMGAQQGHVQLKRVYDWFDRLVFLQSQRYSSPNSTADYIQQSIECQKRVITFLKSADLGIIDYHVKIDEVPFEKYLENHGMPSSVADALITEMKNSTDNLLPSAKTIDLSFVHQGEPGYSAALKPTEQSDGTIHLFELLGPLFSILDRGGLLLLDEIDCSLHPHLVHNLLRLFHDKNMNPKGAQLIFTTHNPLLMEKELLRRDQIWFVEKARDGMSSLYPLTDFSPRETEALTKGYLAGRYGALPFLDWETLKQELINAKESK